MPDLVLNNVKAKLQMWPEKTTTIHCSNDRPNIYLVEEMKHSVKSMLDLESILHLDGKMQPPKFMVFINKRNEAQELMEKKWENLPPELEIWGIMCTDTAGMMGRGARKTGMMALGVYLVESNYFDGNKSKVTAGKWKQGKTSDGRRGKMLKKAKSKQSTANVIESDTSDGDGSNSEEEDDAGQPNMMAEQLESCDNQASTCPGPPPSTDSTTAVLAPQISGMSDGEYEFSAMDTYINARSHSICWQKALHEQTDWCHAEKYGSVIIEMVKSCAPLPPPPPPPLLPTASSSSLCLALQASNRMCLQWKSKTMPSTDKNIPPITSNQLPLSAGADAPSTLGKVHAGVGAVAQLGT
ncbi:hypothetical protein L208DRAFT_1374831 [Tricholoma matsutake]|nr:hypothetical protein L208DRAFT_1374831 [Tricholoma matsutake 945]